MSNPTTRRRLIDTIAEHQFSGKPGKIKLSDIAAATGISRQALNRYYGDLKPYITGEKPIGELLMEAEPQATSQMLIQNQGYIGQLEEQLSQIKKDHQKELSNAIDNHITTLMNNDISLMESNTIRATLERQTMHVAELRKQVNTLELALTKATLSSLQATPTGSLGEKLILNVDLERLSGTYSQDQDYVKFEDSRDTALETITKTINKLDGSTPIKIILYSERFISNFMLFSEAYVPQSGGIHVLVRAPIYQRSAFMRLIKSVTPPCSWVVYVPQPSSPAVKQIQRKFWFDKMPPLELKAADAAELPKLDWGFDQVIQIKTNQGE